MWRVPDQRDFVSVEAGAGLALVCAYSNSDEYEAEIVRLRREAGAYRAARWRWIMPWLMQRRPAGG